MLQKVGDNILLHQAPSTRPYKYPDSGWIPTFIFTLTQPRNTFASYGYEIWTENLENYYGRVDGPEIDNI